MLNFNQWVQESKTEGCPLCNGPMVMQCKCGGPIKHTLEMLIKGHGMQCANGHRWSDNTSDGKIISYDPKGELKKFLTEAKDKQYALDLGELSQRFGLNEKIVRNCIADIYQQ